MIEYDDFGNIMGIDIPDYNIIKKDDSINVVLDKQKAQYKLFIGEEDEDARVR